MSLRFEREAIEYADLGFDTLPLAPGTKRAIVKGWQTRAPLDMWRDAPSDSNIGLRCGGDAQFAVIDADDKHNSQTSANVARYLAGLGFDAGDYPAIATPSNGRHFYLTLDGALSGNYRLLSPSIGAGEFRFGCGAYVGAPPSVVNGKPYQRIAGDLRTLARVEPRDVLPILKNQATTNTTPTVSRHAWKLLRGEGLDRYYSRSEHEQAILASLINTGNDFDSVLSLFLKYPCGGKFRELSARNPPRAIKWLAHSFDKAKQFVESHESRGRRAALSAMEWAYAHTWSGKTGATDRAVFLAHCRIAQRAGRIEYAASCRELAELA